MDIIVANSENVRRRLRSFLGVSSQVIYPPCDTAAFRWIDQDDYYLSFSRLDPLKRVDLAIRAFRELPERRLVVVSSGPEEDRLRRLAAGAANIEVRGRVSQAQLREAIGRCVATIHLPRDEDFGLAPVESMSAGKPVIGVREGGLLETVVEGETGLLVDADPTPSEVAEAVLAMDSTRAAAMRRACEERAQAFDLHMFLGRMRDIITP
jgi:glycosyltransferase involved in cell wall biosynthesis